MDGDEHVLIQLARMEGKLDLVNSRLEAGDRAIQEHAARIRDLELKPVITRNGLWAAIVSTATLVGVATTVLANVRPTN